MLITLIISPMDNFDITSYNFFHKLKLLPFVQKIYLYGSRAKGDSTPSSDIDIALSLSPNHSKNDWLAVSDIIHNADTLLKIDCLDLDSISDHNPLKVNVLKNSVLMFDKSSEKINLAFSKLNDALSALETVIKLPPDPDRIVIDATIQRFEFSFELFWLLLKEVIRSKGIKDVSFPRDVLSAAFSHNLISNEDVWLNMLSDRNKTSHTYDKELADIIYNDIKSYFPIMKSSFADLKSKFSLK